MWSRVSQICDGVARRWRRFRWRCFGVVMGQGCWIQKIEIPRNHRRIRLDTEVALDTGVVLLVNGEAETMEPAIHVGAHTYINRYTIIDAAESIRIGASSMIGPNCYITDHDHGMVLGTPIAEQPFQSQPVLIGEGAWIGAGATILKGVTVGAGAVIGAGSVVTKDVPENAIAVGVPARVVGMREAVE